MTTPVHIKGVGGDEGELEFGRGKKSDEVRLIEKRGSRGNEGQRERKIEE